MNVVDYVSALKNILDLFDDASAIIGDDTYIYYTNQQFHSLTGHTLEDFLSHRVTVCDIFAPFYDGCPIGTREISHTEFAIKHKTGRIFNCIATTKKIPHSNFRLFTLRNKTDVVNAYNRGMEEIRETLNQNIALVKYRFDKIGPVPEVALNIETIDEDEVLLNQLGIYYMTTVQNNYGLFGPLPVVGKDNLIAMLYSYQIATKDSNYEEFDARFKGALPFLIIIIFPETHSFLFDDRKRILRVLENTTQKSSYMSDDPDIVRRLLYQIKIQIIENPSLISSESGFESKLSALNSIILSSLSKASKKDVFETIADLSDEFLDFKFFSAWQVDRAINGLKLVVNRGYDESTDGAIINLDSSSIIARCVRTKTVQNVKDVTIDADYMKADDNIVKSELVVPILSPVDRRVVGAINLEETRENAFDAEDELVLKTIAEKIAFYLDREELESRFMASYEFWKKIHSNQKLSPLQVLHQAGIFFEKNLSFKLFATLIINKENNLLEIVDYRGYEERDIKDLKISFDSKSIVTESMKLKQPLNIGDVHKVDYYLAGDPNVKSELAVPICINNMPYGVFNFESYSYDAFSELDQRLLMMVSDVISSYLVKSLGAEPNFTKISFNKTS